MEKYLQTYNIYLDNLINTGLLIVDQQNQQKEEDWDTRIFFNNKSKKTV